MILFVGEAVQGKCRVVQIAGNQHVPRHIGNSTADIHDAQSQKRAGCGRGEGTDNPYRARGR